MPAAIAGTLIANPLTLVPMYLAAYGVGCRLLELRMQNVGFELTWHWLSTTLVPIWKRFLLGCLIMGSTAAVLGYILLGSLWHISLVLKYHKRQGTDARKESALSEK